MRSILLNFKVFLYMMVFFAIFMHSGNYNPLACQSSARESALTFLNGKALTQSLNMSLFIYVPRKKCYLEERSLWKAFLFWVYDMKTRFGERSVSVELFHSWVFNWSLETLQRTITANLYIKNYWILLKFYYSTTCNTSHFFCINKNTWANVKCSEVTGRHVECAHSTWTRDSYH